MNSEHINDVMTLLTLMWCSPRQTKNFSFFSCVFFTLGLTRDFGISTRLFYFILTYETTLHTIVSNV